MARMTDVANSNLCPIPKNKVQKYIDFVADFANKYAGKATITIPNDAAKWEGHVADGNDRLDLQGSENGYGNIQAQFGKGHASCKTGGSYGGVLLVCDTPFSIADVQAALLRSLNTGGTHLVKVDLEPVVIENKAASKASKNKPGKPAWTPDTVYQ